MPVIEVDEADTVPVLLDGLTRLEYRFAGDWKIEAYPHALTDFYLDRPLEIYGRIPAQAGRGAVRHRRGRQPAAHLAR